MQPEHGAEIDLGQHVAVEHHDRLGQLIAGIPDGAAGAERLRLHDIAQTDPEAFSLAEDLLDATRLIVQAEDRFVDLRHLAQQIQLVVQERPVENRNDRLGRMDRERPKARAFASGEQNGFHIN